MRLIPERSMKILKLFLSLKFFLKLLSPQEMYVSLSYLSYMAKFQPKNSHMERYASLQSTNLIIFVLYCIWHTSGIVPKIIESCFTFLVIQIIRLQFFNFGFVFYPLSSLICCQCLYSVHMSSMVYISTIVSKKYSKSLPSH